MKKVKGRGNPVAASPLLRKGGAHVKSNSALRSDAKNKLRRGIAEWQPDIPQSSIYLEKTRESGFFMK